MTFLYIVPIIFTGLIGFHCEITTVRNVPVKIGGSISIPCLYEQSYTNHVKFLCSGFWSMICVEVIATNQTKPPPETFSISDNTNQRIFTVTIKNLTDKEKHLWCAVKIKNNVDVKQYFQLSVSSGMPSLYVSKQEITALERGSVTVACHCKNPEITGWCRLGSTCVKNQSGLILGTAVKIDASVPNVFKVTMSNLRTESSGWYWCACNGRQMPVHVTVHELVPITTTTPLISKTRDVDLHPAQLTHSSITEAGSRNIQDEQQGPNKVIIIITTLLSQLLIILAAFFRWRIRKYNGTNPEVFDISMDEDCFYSDVLYATIDHNQHARVMTENNIHPESVTHSSIAVMDNAQ